jgi:hypothetical protein
MFLTEIREWLAGPRQVVEGSRFRRNANLRVDPRTAYRDAITAGIYNW